MPTLDLHVEAPSDDCRRCRDVGDSFLTGNALEAGSTAERYSKWGSGIRFVDVAVPRGAAITIASLQICAQGSGGTGTDCSSVVRGEASDDAATFSTAADFDAREMTAASVQWEAMPPWTASTWYTAPDLSAVVQEIVDRPGWEDGNALVLVWEDFAGISALGANRLGYSVVSGPSLAAKLSITFNE
jgi:hypothetical protein